MEFGICRLCKEEKYLIESHIIPKVFFRYLHPPGDTRPLILIGGKRIERRPIGVYDPFILCRACDGSMSGYDDYAHKLLLKEGLKFYPTADEVRPSEAYTVPSFDYKKLKLFFLSLLWRASISRRPEFHYIETGVHEEQLRQIILNGNPGLPDEFAVFLAKYDEGKLGDLANRSILLPRVTKMSGINYSVFYLPNNIEVYIKVDKRSSPKSFGLIPLSPNRPLAILRMGDYENSRSFVALLSAVRRHARLE